MSKYTSAWAVLVLAALAGCGSPAGTSAGATGSGAAGSASPGGGTSPAATSGAGATASATSNSFVSAGSVPFPIAVGNTWVYQVTSGVNGENGTATNRVVSVVPVAGGHRVTMSGSVQFGGVARTTRQTYVFYANGTIGYPVNGVNGVSVADSGGVRWPDAADLASGRTYRSVLRVRVSGGGPARYQAANVTVRGGGTAPVTVPAGTYRASIVDMVLSTKVGRFGTSVLVKTWAAPDVGPVKSQVSVLAAGSTKLITTERLLTFTRGS